jgi:ABC-type cobalamin/Fe3+-siderophores transport system ATPase subunit
MDKNKLIGIVGPCGAGKSTLIADLKKSGYNARQIAQEHSYVPDMWKRLSRPHVLIFLEVSYSNTVIRRKLDWTENEYLEQLKRLDHAYQHANIIIDTNNLTSEQVFEKVIKLLYTNGK